MHYHQNESSFQPTFQPVYDNQQFYPTNPQPVHLEPFPTHLPPRGSFVGVQNNLVPLPGLRGSFMAQQQNIAPPLPYNGVPVPPPEIYYEDVPVETQVMEFQPVMKSVKDFYTVEKVRNMVPKIEYEQVMVPTWQPKVTYEAVEQSYVHGPSPNVRRSFVGQQEQLPPYQVPQYQPAVPLPSNQFPVFIPPTQPQYQEYQVPMQPDYPVDRIHSRESVYRSKVPYTPVVPNQDTQASAINVQNSTHKSGVYHTLM